MCELEWFICILVMPENVLVPNVIRMIACNISHGISSQVLLKQLWGHNYIIQLLTIEALDTGGFK